MAENIDPMSAEAYETGAHVPTIEDMSRNTSPTVIIIGAGFGGIGMAIELRQAGIEDVTILERASEVGGVWRENTYPGAGCDVPSPLYSYSFEPKSDWPKRFSMQADILQYLEDTVDKHGVRDRIRFGSTVEGAEFDEHTGQWTVRLADGTELVADVLIPATGQLSRPALPKITGLNSFEGDWFHSAEWNHDVDLTGKRVAVIGTGASAIQFVPAIAPTVGELTLFQRTAAWVLPKADIEYKPWHHKIFQRIPATRLTERFAIWALCEVMSLALIDIPQIQPAVIALANRHRRKLVPDPELRRKLTPDYPAGCKRGLFSNEYYPALARPNVTVETTSIERITPTGVTTTDGIHHEVDVIVYGTGFKATEFLGPITISGVGGRKLTDVWSNGARAHLGITVPDFPNMFLMYGPNTNLGVGSIVYMLESQARYIRQAVQALAANPGRYLTVRPEVEEKFDARLQRRLDRSPWNFCHSWYRNAAGRITNNWPGTVTQYRLLTRRLDLEDYQLTAAPATETIAS